MASFGGGVDEENAELKRLNNEMLEDPDNFEAWEKLVRTAESLEGGVNRNSSPQAIAAVRDIYDRFLTKFPLFFGYWKKYADLEFNIAGSEAADLVYERGVASVSNCVDLWTQYCAFKNETSHDPEVIRELFERGASSVGLDFLAHPFWDEYLKFEERQEAYDRVFAVLARVITIPMHQYARYFERYRNMASGRPVAETCPSEMLAQFRAEVEMNSAANPTSEQENERELRQRIDGYHMEIFNKCYAETNKRWVYEQEIKRPYFHVTELDEAQLSNWNKYLDFEEADGDYQRIVFLYERCLVAAAYYDQFWLRYSRWMLTQMNKVEEVRNIYQRASCFYAPIARPTIRLHYALFEEMEGRTEVAQDIYGAILVAMPGHVETIIALTNSVRRQRGLDAAIEICKEQMESTSDTTTRAALVAEWARLLWKVKGSPEEARELFQNNQPNYLDSHTFWSSYLDFELGQPTNNDSEPQQYARLKQVFDDIRRKSHLMNEEIKKLSESYMTYLLERGGEDTSKEYLTLDRELNGPLSVQQIRPAAHPDPMDIDVNTSLKE